MFGEALNMFRKQHPEFREVAQANVENTYIACVSSLGVPRNHTDDVDMFICVRAIQTFLSIDRTYGNENLQ